LSRLWYPNEEGVTIARFAMSVAVPLILLAPFLLGFLVPKVPVFLVSMILLAAVILLRAIILVRGAYTLPVTEDNICKHRNISPDQQRTFRVIGFILPFVSTLILLFKPELFAISFSISVIIAVIFLAFSGISLGTFVCVAGLYFCLSFLLVTVQAGITMTLGMTMLIWGLVLPSSYANLVNTRKVIADNRTELPKEQGNSF
jgi:hypothetical protein